MRQNQKVWGKIKKCRAKSNCIKDGIYTDDGFSGTNFKRPGFRKMITDVEDGNVNCIIVKDLSRFGRDYIDTGRYLERIFPELGVRFISVTDGIDSMRQAYDLLLPIKNVFNEQYARDISGKIHATIQAKQRAGEFVGSFASYGYRKSPADKNKLVIDEYAAGVVRRIFALYIQGCGKQRIARLLNEEGVLCPTEYKRVNGENYKNLNRLGCTAYWTYSTVNSILHKEIYAGNMVQGTKFQRMRGRQKNLGREDWIVVENTHEAIIDRDTWEMAQSLLHRRTRNMHLDINKNVFAGYVKCGDCGRSMVKNVRKRPDGSRTYAMNCGTYKRIGKKYCTPHSVPLNVLEEIVLSDLKKIIRSVDGLKEKIRAQSVGVSEGGKMADRGRDRRYDEGHNREWGRKYDKEYDRMKSELLHVKKLKKYVYVDYREGLISREEFLAYRGEYLEKEELYVKQLEVLKGKKEEKNLENIFETPWLKRFLETGEVERLDREIVTEMINEIRVYEGHRIKIIYNFLNERGLIF